MTVAGFKPPFPLQPLHPAGRADVYSVVRGRLGTGMAARSSPVLCNCNLFYERLPNGERLEIFDPNLL